MSPNSSGIFPFSQTGPSADPSGSAWDTTTVEGPQNFFADQGDSEDYTFNMGHFTAGKPQTTSEDFQTTWMPAPTAAGEKTHKAEPMRRISTRGPAKSHRVSKASSSKSQPRPHSVMSQGAPVASKFDISGNARTFYLLAWTFLPGMRP